MSTRKRTLESITAELQKFGFPYDVAVSLWHRQHGRDEEADEAMQAYFDEIDAKQEQLRVAELLAKKESESKETGYETKQDS